MTRPYAATRLLEHGPLTFAEMLEITGWSEKTLESALRRLMRQGTVRRLHQRGRHRHLLALS